jgi:hypothetical protein
MRRYQRIVMFLAIAAVVLYWGGAAVWLASLAWLEEHKKADAFDLANASQSSLAYELSTRQWLEFAIPEASPELRVISNLNVNSKADSQAAAGAIPERRQYALHYQLVGRDGKVLADRVYYQNSRLSVYRDEQGNLYHANYYRDSSLTPLDGRLMLLGLRLLPKVAYLRLKLEAADPQIAGAVVRVYVPAKIAEHRIGTRWLRLNQRQKEALAEHSVYPASHLSEQERLNLIRHQWSPVGPRGVKGKDYEALALYALDDVSYDKIEEQILPYGALGDALHPVTIPLPEQGGRLFLALKTANAGVQSPSGVPIELRWFGRTQKERWQREVLWDGSSAQVDFPVPGGLLEVRPLAPLVVVRALLQSARGEPTEIDLRPFTTAAVYADAGVEYNALHIGDKPAAVRVDVRRVFAGGGSGPPASITYQWLNRDGQIVHAGQLQAPDTPSRYERLKLPEPGYEISDPHHYYFTVPSSVQRIRISAERRDVLVSLYKQPDAMIKHAHIPEDVYGDVQADENWSPGWFIVKPLNEKALLMQQSIQPLAVQLHPPEDDPYLAQGQYLWQDYLPENRPQAHYLLSLYEPDVQRDGALPGLYCQIPVNRAFQAAVKSSGERRTVTPELIFMQPDERHVDFSLSANRQELVHAGAMGRQDAFYLPELTPGTYSLKLSSSGSGGQWLMNDIADCSGPQYLKRKVFRLERQNKLVFTVDHGAALNETLSAKIYVAAGREKRSLIDVGISPLNVAAGESGERAFNDWTFRRRSFDVRHPQQDASLLLFTGGKRLNGGESFFIPVNSDLPGGQYRIEISLADGAPGFLALSKVTPGLHPQRHLYHESKR